MMNCVRTGVLLALMPMFVQSASPSRAQVIERRTQPSLNAPIVVTPDNSSTRDRFTESRPSKILPNPLRPDKIFRPNARHFDGSLDDTNKLRPPKPEIPAKKVIRIPPPPIAEISAVEVHQETTLKSVESNDLPESVRRRATAADKAASALRPPMQSSSGRVPIERLPPLFADEVDGDFPPLPPDPYAADKPPLPPLDEELWHHGGAHLYEPEGDRRNWPAHPNDVHHDLLRLPEDWQKPEPVTAFQEFLGADPIHDRPHLHWPGTAGYAWEPRFVAYGGYELFGFAMKDDDTRRDALGHQLIVDFDLRLTGTERFHVQFRPLGKRSSGGSYYQFSDPEGYVDNSTAEPERYWFEGELHSILGGLVNPFAVLDYQITAGRFPFVLHNGLLMNDEFLGVALNKNTIYLGPLSNLNVQLFYGFNDVDSFTNADAQVYGVNATADYHNEFYELTYAFVQHESDSSQDSHYAALSRTKLYGPLMLAGRGMFKWGDQATVDDGQLFVLESSYTRAYDHHWLGVETGVFYCNAFYATEGWSSIANGNFNRLRASFEVDPLVQVSAFRPAGDTWGAALGVQLFRHHQDESIIPEIAFETPGGTPVWGFGLRYFRKTGKRSFLEVLGVINSADDPRLDREGVFASETILF